MRYLVVLKMYTMRFLAMHTKIIGQELIRKEDGGVEVDIQLDKQMPEWLWEFLGDYFRMLTNDKQFRV